MRRWQTVDRARYDAGDKRGTMSGKRRIVLSVVVAGALGLSLLTACTEQQATAPQALDAARPYDYPILDAFAATVIGTPSSYQPDLPEIEDRDDRELIVFPDRNVPDVFWYHDTLRYAVAYQKQPAPLVFNIAGTGASHNSGVMHFMERVFFAAGFHVVSLPSPTHPNFIVTASDTGVPGRVSEDSRDLYRVMRLIRGDLERRIDITGFALSGYSLGAMQAAFVANLDESERDFQFDKVLLLNPPLNLYNSVRILDRLPEDNIPGGMENFANYFNRVFEEFYEVYAQGTAVNLTDDFLYQAWIERDPPEENLAALVGLAFRLSSTNMIFTADVVSKAGYLVPKDHQLTNTSPLSDYFKVGARLRFQQYMEEFFFPFYRAKEPDLTLQDLIDEASLLSIESYLSQSDKIIVLHNEDDIILEPGESAEFKRIFGDRALLFPSGGHLGNSMHAHVAAEMVEWLRH